MSKKDSFSELGNMVATQTIIEKLSLDDSAKVVVNVYDMSCRRRYHSSISKAGVELDVAKCYLQNMTIHQIVKWIKVNKKVTVSKSAVGRFCKRLLNSGIAPIGSAHAYAFKLPRNREGA
jgi:hypothetical protein